MPYHIAGSNYTRAQLPRLPIRHDDTNEPTHRQCSRAKDTERARISAHDSGTNAQSRAKMGGEDFPSDSKATKAPMEQEIVPLIARTKTHRHATNGVQLMSGMVILIAIASVIAMCVHNGYDNDIWFILATGRRIAEHGIPYTNPFSVYQGMAFVAQQWLVCLIDWLIWSTSGFVGLGVLLLAECIILLLSMRHAIASASGTNRIGIGALCLMLLVMSAASSYISFRPQVITMTLMTLTISVMERYRKTNDARTLGWLLPITALHANLHMSMMWMDVAIVCCYAMPPARCLNRALAWLELGYRHIALLLDDDEATGTRRERMIDTLPTTWHVQFVEDGYGRIPILKVLAMMLVATCANPYGISGATYLFAGHAAECVIRHPARRMHRHSGNRDRKAGTQKGRPADATRSPRNDTRVARAHPFGMDSPSHIAAIRRKDARHGTRRKDTRLRRHRGIRIAQEHHTDGDHHALHNARRRKHPITHQRAIPRRFKYANNRDGHARPHLRRESAR